MTKNSGESRLGEPLETEAWDRFDGKLTAVIPAYNEGAAIFSALLETARTLAGFADEYELIVVDDGSSDNTRAEAERAQRQQPHITIVSNPSNQGKGMALKTGVAAADGRGYIAFVDADLDLHPRQLLTLYQTMRKTRADCAIGSKMHPDSRLSYPASRRLISFGYYCVLKLLFGLNVHDTQTGLKLFPAGVIQPVMRIVLVKRFAYDIEVLTILNRLGYRIAEAPIELVFSRNSSWSRIRFRDIWRTAVDTAAVFYRLNILRYYDKELKRHG